MAEKKEYGLDDLTNAAKKFESAINLHEHSVREILELGQKLFSEITGSDHKFTSLDSVKKEVRRILQEEIYGCIGRPQKKA